MDKTILAALREMKRGNRGLPVDITLPCGTNIAVESTGNYDPGYFVHIDSSNAGGMIRAGESRDEVRNDLSHCYGRIYIGKKALPALKAIIGALTARDKGE